jgi:hypothetical protein
MRLLSSEQEVQMTTSLYDHINELRAELHCCVMTPRERAQAQAELAEAIAEQAALDRAFDAALGADRR